MEESGTLELQAGASPEALLPDHGLWPWWLAALGALLAVIVFFLIRRRGKRWHPDPAAQREAAWCEAQAALQAIPATADARAAAVQASLVIRKYLSVAAADPALFETHEEFIARHDSLAALTPATRTVTQETFDWLATWKYAPQPPATGTAEVLARSRALLEALHHGFPA